MLRPAIFVALIFRTITAIQTFDIPYAMTGGGPGDSTETLAMYIHKTTLDFLDFGYGSALADADVPAVVALTSGYLKYTRRSSGRARRSETPTLANDAAHSMQGELQPSGGRAGAEMLPKSRTMVLIAGIVIVVNGFSRCCGSCSRRSRPRRS